MKVKKLTKVFIALSIIAFMIFNISKIYAIDASVDKENRNSNMLKLGATLWRNNTEKKQEAESDLMGYLTSHSDGEGTAIRDDVKVWKLVQQEGDATTIDSSKAIYCLKAGIGFTNMLNENTYTATGVEYNKSFNMYNKENVMSIMGWNEEDKTYEKVMWIINNMYTKGVDTLVNRDELLKKVNYTDADGITKSLYDWMATPSTLEDITDNDIEVVQQLALWYYTNSSEEKYHRDNVTLLELGFKQNLTDEEPTFNSLSDMYISSSDPDTPDMRYGARRIVYMDALFKYFIDNAEANKDEEPTNSNVIKATFWTYEGEDSTENPRQPVVIIEKAKFDLALRKIIVKVENSTESKQPFRGQGSMAEPVVDVSNLNDGTDTTATYKHRKDPVVVKKGDIITYHINIYNEGDVAGRATQIKDQLPDGLEYYENTAVETPGYTYDYDEDTNIITITENTDQTNLNPFVTGNTTLDSKTITVQCKVTGTVSNKVLTNVAWINEAISANGVDDRDSQPSTYPNVNQADLPDYKGTSGNTDLADDSYFYKGQQDDDDFEKVILQQEEIDLALRKFITAVKTQKGDTFEETELIDETTGKYLREPDVDVSNLNKIVNGELVKTATYKHTKMPLTVQVGDIVTYTIRVYNEGGVDGYVSEITDHLPKWLEFVDDTVNYPEETAFNQSTYLWVKSDDGKTIKTNITAGDIASGTVAEGDIYWDREQERGTGNGKLLKAFDEAKQEIDYIDVKIKCKVIDDVSGDKLEQGEKITNIADITGMTDANKVEVKTDRDSTSNNVNLPETDEAWSEYHGKDNKDYLADKDYYYKGQEDDDDFEKVVVQSFDLALRKFITEVDGSIGPVNNRYPTPVYDADKNKITYVHPKNPVDVVTGDVVIYTIRVYNEGNVDGYAQEITDDLPEYLTFLPDHEINKAYGWVLRDKDGNVVTDAEDAVCITTDYLKRKEILNEDGTITVDDTNLLKAFDKDAAISDTDPKNPDYRDIQVAMQVDLQVTQDNLEDAKRILINEAQISEDADKDGQPIDDVDSEPKRDDKYNYDGDNEDDIDYEPVKVNYFDLALKKWVTQSIVTENGKTTVTESGHTGDENPEPPMKVEIKSKSINKVNVKFRFNIKVTNEGEIAGYATEVTDHIPEGLEFVQEDNPEWYAKDGNLVATRALEETLLQPGESATVDIILQWVNGNNNFGLKTNYAEISEDKNKYDIPDIDSTPGNLNGEPVEDDEDQAPVVLSIKTGEAPMYIALTTSMVGMFTGGVLMIKKYVI